MTNRPFPEDRVHPGSFRDPSGFLFTRDRVLYRQVNVAYRDHYDLLMRSGLYKTLSEAGLLVRHEEVDIAPADPRTATKILKPERIPFISYPYEWCFGELKDAALATLRIQKTAMDFGMSLKDASAYNIQFAGGRPVLIDTLSFENLQLKPWVAYRQFCQHFLGPLVLMSRKDDRLGLLSKVFLDGFPLDLAAKLLPAATRLRPGLLMHLHLHAASQKHYSGKMVDVKGKRISIVSLAGLISSLESVVRKTVFQLQKTEWGDYYRETNYSEAAFEEKKKIISDFLDLMKPGVVWDLGANTGVFSRLASSRGIETISFDVDHAAVELNYRQVAAEKDRHLLPLVLDLANPSPSLGWAGEERESWIGRGPADAVFALALIHHLAISNNVPFSGIAGLLRRISTWLVIEFVPKGDSQVQRLLATREDVFPGYTQPDFESEFGRYFRVEKKVPVSGSERTLYLMKARADTA